MALILYPGTDNYTTVTVSGLYDNNTESPLFAPTGSTAPTSGIMVGGTDSNGNFQSLSQTPNGYLNVNASVTAMVVTGSDTVSNATLTSLSSTDEPLVTAGYSFNGTTWDRARNAGIGNNVVSTGIAASAAYGQFNTAEPTITSGNYTALQTDSHGNLFSDVNYFATVLLGPTAVVAFGTPPAAVNVPAVNSSIFSGTTALTNTGGALDVNITGSSGNTSVVGTLTNNNAAPAANNLGVLPAIAGSEAGQAYTSGDQVLLTTTTTGALRDDTYSVAGVALGPTAVTNFGSAPAAAAVPGVNASLFAGVTGITATGSSLNVNVTNTVPVTLTSTTITGTVAVTQSTSPWVVSLTSTTITGTVAVTQSTSPWVVNMTQWAGTALGVPTAFGTTPTAVVAGSVNSSLFIGTTAAVAAAAGIQKVGISGATGVTLDAAQNAAAPANELVVGAVFNTTTPALTAGNASQLQADSTGSLQVNTEGKKQSYRCGIIGFTPIANATAPFVSMTGSATKTIRIVRIRVSVGAVTGAATNLALYRFSALSGGTAASQSANIAKNDTNNAAATAVVNLWSVAATTATSTGILAAERYQVITASVSVQAGAVEWDFGDVNEQACVLRGTGDFIGIQMPAVGTTPTGDCWVEWTEE